MNTQPTKPPRAAPYVAPGAPRSPMVLAIAGAITAVLAVLARIFNLEVLNVDPELVLATVAGIVTVVGVIQDRGARAEQAAGVPALQAAKDEIPPGASGPYPGDPPEDWTTSPRAVAPPPGVE